MVRVGKVVAIYLLYHLFLRDLLYFRIFSSVLSGIRKSAPTDPEVFDTYGPVHPVDLTVDFILKSTPTLS